MNNEYGKHVWASGPLLYAGKVSLAGTSDSIVGSLLNTSRFVQWKMSEYVGYQKKTLLCT